MANEKLAYTMSDRATYLSMSEQLDLVVLTEGDSILFNQYGVVQINPEKCPSVSQENAELFINWLLSVETQQAIANFKVDGQQLFYPNAR